MFLQLSSCKVAYSSPWFPAHRFHSRHISQTLLNLWWCLRLALVKNERKFKRQREKKKESNEKFIVMEKKVKLRIKSVLKLNGMKWIAYNIFNKAIENIKTHKKLGGISIPSIQIVSAKKLWNKIKTAHFCLHSKCSHLSALLAVDKSLTKLCWVAAVKCS